MQTWRQGIFCVERRDGSEDKHMQAIICQVPGREGWFIKLVSSGGVFAGELSYPSIEAAVDAARQQHPDKEIEIEN